MKTKHIFLLAIAAGALAPLLWLAITAPTEGLNFPSDDAWIHQVFARNIARSGMFAYNPGERSVGVTGPLWTLAASEFHFFRLPFIPATIALSILSHVLWVAAIFWLMRAVWPEERGWWAAAAAVLFTVLGPPVWFAVSGMETSLFFALATLAAAALGRGRHAWAGLAAAATVPVRPEGGLLVAMLFLWWVWRLWREKRKPLAGEVVGYVAMPLLVITPFLAQNIIVGGSLMPTTFGGRHWLYAGADAVSHVITWRGPAILAFYWYRYIHVWTLGWNDFCNGAKIFTDPVVFSQLGLWVAVFFIFRRRLNAGLAFFIIWVLGHNLLYGFFLTNFGTAGRYQGCNFALFAVGLVFGAKTFYDWARDRAVKAVPIIFVGAALVSAGGSYYQWRLMYADNIYHITHVHEAAGKWVAANIPPGEHIAAFDIGAFGYYANHYVVDLGGLVDPEAVRYLKRKEMCTYIHERNVRYVALMELDSPEIRPLGERFGFYRDMGSAMNMSLVRAWELPVARRSWLGVTAIAYPTLSFYEVYYYKQF